MAANPKGSAATTRSCQGVPCHREHRYIGPVTLASIGIGWMLLIFFGGTFAFFFALGKMTWGTGADLVDWDPAERQAAKMELDAEDAMDLLEITNRRRRANGLEELTQDDVLAQIARRNRDVG